jgi:hypothetical protein
MSQTLLKERKGQKWVPKDLIVYWILIQIQVDGILEKIYANMSACHLKNQNWKRALETADKVQLLIFKVTASSLSFSIGPRKE